MITEQGASTILFHFPWFVVRVYWVYGTLLILVSSVEQSTRGGSRIVGTSNFLRNLRFHKVILPDSLNLIWSSCQLDAIWDPLVGKSYDSTINYYRMQTIFSFLPILFMEVNNGM